MTQKVGRLDKAVRIDSITIGTRHRRIADDGIEDLALSIQDEGLLNPITLTEDHTLVAGHRRLKAYMLMDRETIPAFIFNYSPLEAELAEIRENLKRDELTVLEHGQHLAREKEIYIELHEETKHGGTPGDKGGGRGKAPRIKGPDSGFLIPSYVDDAAKLTGKSKAVIKENIKLAKDIDKKAQEDLKDTPTADRKGELKRIAKMPAPEQRKIAKQLKSGKITKVPPKAPEPPRVTDSKLSTKDDWNKLMNIYLKKTKDHFQGMWREFKEHPGGNFSDVEKDIVLAQLKIVYRKLNQAKHRSST